MSTHSDTELIKQKRLGRPFLVKDRSPVTDYLDYSPKKRLGHHITKPVSRPSTPRLPPTPPVPDIFLEKKQDWTQVDVLLTKTLLLILPDGLKYAMEIEHFVQHKGFTIIQKRKVQLSSEQASEFMYKYYGLLIYLPLVCYLTSAPIIAICVAKKNAVEELKKISGPENIRIAYRDFPYTIRAIFGDPQAEDPVKVIHCSLSEADAEREIHFFFPELILFPFLRGFEVNDYLHDRLLSTLRDGLAQLLQEKPIDPVIWLADWLLCNNPYKPKVKREIALTET